MATAFSLQVMGARIQRKKFLGNLSQSSVKSLSLRCFPTGILLEFSVLVLSRAGSFCGQERGEGGGWEGTRGWHRDEEGWHIPGSGTAGKARIPSPEHPPSEISPSPCPCHSLNATSSIFEVFNYSLKYNLCKLKRFPCIREQERASH